MRTIAEQWAQFSALVMRSDMPAAQHREMRRAFYGGCEAMLRLNLSICDLSDEAGAGCIEGWHDECRRFGESIARGEA